MTSQTPPAGWYPDPGAPEGRTGQRYWDGSAWTEHVVANPVPGPSKPTTTPDGVPLAGWGRRLGAYLIDGLIGSVIALAVGFPFLRGIIREEIAFFDRSVNAAESGGQAPGQLDMYAAIYPDLLKYSLVALVVLVLYQGLFLRFLGGTPGKLMLGMRVRLRETPGQLPWSVIARRLLATNVIVTVVTAIPVVGSIGGLYALIDGLWALRDDHRQTLHDKFAGTNVVRTS